MVYRILLMMFCIAVCTFTVLADTLHMKDGTTIEGRVYDQGDNYFVKDTNGDTHLIDKSTVDSWTKSSAVAPSASPAAVQSRSATPTGSASFASTKAKAQASETAIAAVGICRILSMQNPRRVI